jgi:AcrR family transcriptional regulator
MRPATASAPIVSPPGAVEHATASDPSPAATAAPLGALAEPGNAPERAPAGEHETAADAPRSARREATRQRILDAAREVIAEMGVSGATVEHICEAAGFTRGAFYSNFADKDEVIDALLDREQNRLLDQLDAMFGDLQHEIAQAGDLATVLRAIVGRVLLAVPLDRELTLVQTELENFAIRRPELAGRFVAVNDRFRTRIAAFLSDAMTRNGRELLVDAVILTDAIIGISQRSVRRALLEGGDADPNEVAGAILPGLLLAFSRRVEA